MSVKVAVRCRPLSVAETNENAKVVIRMNDKSVQVTECGEGQGETFNFDEALWSVSTHPENSKNPMATQEVVYNSVALEMLNHVMTGYNGCIFAYGQTGSGKTYSMIGVEEEPGVNPRIAKSLFLEVQNLADTGVESCVEISFFEIYNEKVRCLLRPTERGFDDSVLRVREHPKFGPFIEGLAKFVVSSENEFLQLLSDGNKVRSTGATAMNVSSSRSHAVFVVTLTQKRTKGRVVTTRTSRLNLVDLAGSERASKTMATGKRFKEGANINKSLTCLGNVISALVEGQETNKARHIPYRDSVLTWILKDNLGGNSKTLMLATISPCSTHYDETMSTLRYADRAKRIVNKAVVNETNDNEVIAALQKEIELLKSQLVGASDADQTQIADALAASEAFQREMQMSLEEKLAETRRHMEEREAYTKRLEAQRDAQHAEIQSLRDDKAEQERQIQELMQRIHAMEAHMLPGESGDIERLREKAALLESQQNAACATDRPTPGRDADDSWLRAEDLGNVRPVEESADGRVTVRALARAYELFGEQQNQEGAERPPRTPMESLHQDPVELRVEMFEKMNTQQQEEGVQRRRGQSREAKAQSMEAESIELVLDESDTMAQEGTGGADDAAEDGSLVLEEDSDLQIDDEEGDGSLAVDEENEGDTSLQVEDVENDQETDRVNKNTVDVKETNENESATDEKSHPANSILPEGEPTEEEGKNNASSTSPRLGTKEATKATLVLLSHDVPNNRFLHEPFKVVKVSETSFIGSRKERIWDVDFFKRCFANLDMAGHMTFEYNSSNLYRVERDPVNSKRLTLYFFEAPHPYELELSSNERRQQFYEVAMTLRRNSIMWCPSLCIEGENDVVVNITGTTIQRPDGKTAPVKGEAKLLVARMPYEVVDFWYGCFSMRGHSLPRSAAVLGSFIPRDSHDVYIIGILDVPPAMVGVEDISRFFLNYLGSAQHYILADTPVQSKKRQTNNAIVVIVRRSFLVRVSHVEAAETTPVAKDGSAKSDYTAVGCALRINEATFCVILVNAKPTNCTALSRAGYIRQLLSGFPFADKSVDIGAGFEYLIVSGAFNFGSDYCEDDLLISQIKAANLMSGMVEASATSALINAAEPVRIFYAIRPRACRLDVKLYTTSRALGMPNAFFSTDVFCRRPFLSLFGEQVRQTQIIFDKICITSPDKRIPPIFSPEVRVSAEWLGKTAQNFPLTKTDETYTASGRTIPALIPTISHASFLKLQSITFSVTGLFEESKRKEKTLVASGVLPLKDLLRLGEFREFAIPLYYRGCLVGTLAGSALLAAFEKNAADLENEGAERDTVVVSCYENEIIDGRKFVPTVFAEHRAYNFSERDVAVRRVPEECELPDMVNWRWLDSWHPITQKGNPEGWLYSEGFNQPLVMGKKKSTTVRRRRWVRVMQANDPITLHNYFISIRASQAQPKPNEEDKDS